MSNGEFFRTAFVPSISGLEEYVRAVSYRCPFAKLSESRGYMRFSVYDDEGLNADSIISIALLHVEMLRAEYVQQCGNQDAWLLNENIVFGNASSPAKVVEILAAHWCTTMLYTESGWVAGKFPKHSYPRDRIGVVVSSSQHDLFSVRKTIADRDARFYQTLGTFGHGFSNQDNGICAIPELTAHVDVQTPCDIRTVKHGIATALRLNALEYVKERVYLIAQKHNVSPDHRYGTELGGLVAAVLSFKS